MTETYKDHGVAERYNAARSLPDVTHELWMKTLKGLLPPDSVSSILDLGAGTGRFSMQLQETFGCNVIAVDPSEAMLDQGRKAGLSEITWHAGTAEHIPLKDDSVDLVWMSQVYHHLEDIPSVFQEIRRVVVPSGHLAIRNGTRENSPELDFMRCFPEAAAIDDARLPSRQEILDSASAYGFQSISVTTIYQRFASSYAEYYHKISQRGLSALVAINDEAFMAGMQRLKEWIASQTQDTAVEEPVDLFVFQVAK